MKLAFIHLPIPFNPLLATNKTLTLLAVLFFIFKNLLSRCLCGFFFVSLLTLLILLFLLCLVILVLFVLLLLVFLLFLLILMLLIILLLVFHCVNGFLYLLSGFFLMCGGVGRLRFFKLLISLLLFIC